MSKIHTNRINKYPYIRESIQRFIEDDIDIFLDKQNILIKSYNSITEFKTNKFDNHVKKFHHYLDDIRFVIKYLEKKIYHESLVKIQMIKQQEEFKQLIRNRDFRIHQLSDEVYFTRNESNSIKSMFYMLIILNFFGVSFSYDNVKLIFNFLVSLTYVTIEYLFNININMTMLSDPNFNLEFNQNDTFNIIEL